MNKCPLNRTDRFGCQFKNYTVNPVVCTYYKSNPECCVKCNYGRPTESDLKRRILELERRIALLQGDKREA